MFNYTRSLEKIYGIDYACVNHIHGKVHDDDDDSDWYDPKEYILGHGLSNEDIMDRDSKQPFNETSCFSYDIEAGEDNTAQLECYSAIDDIKKPVDELIEFNADFWESLHDVHTVVIAGMSFSPIDEKYLREVYNNVSPSVNTIVYVYSEDDQNNVSLRLTTSCLIDSDWQHLQQVCPTFQSWSKFGKVR